MNTQGSIALVTGASSGIGKATAERLATAGRATSVLAVAARSAEDAEAQARAEVPAVETLLSAI